MFNSTLEKVFHFSTFSTSWSILKRRWHYSHRPAPRTQPPIYLQPTVCWDKPLSCCTSCIHIHLCYLRHYVCWLLFHMSCLYWPNIKQMKLQINIANLFPRKLGHHYKKDHHLLIYISQIISWNQSKVIYLMLILLTLLGFVNIFLLWIWCNIYIW